MAAIRFPLAVTKGKTSSAGDQGEGWVQGTDRSGAYMQAGGWVGLSGTVTWKIAVFGRRR